MTEFKPGDLVRDILTGQMMTVTGPGYWADEIAVKYPNGTLGRVDPGLVEPIDNESGRSVSRQEHAAATTNTHERESVMNQPTDNPRFNIGDRVAFKPAFADVHRQHAEIIDMPFPASGIVTDTETDANQQSAGVTFTRPDGHEVYLRTSSHLFELVEPAREYSEDHLYAELIHRGASSKTTVQQLCQWAIELGVPASAALDAYTAVTAGEQGAHRG